jgi:hypothetical protein
MVTFIQNVNDIDADRRQALERVVGQNLRATQQVVIRVIDMGKEPSTNLRNDSLEKAAEIARRGRIAAAAQGVADGEVDLAIDEALRNVRRKHDE